MTNMDIIEAFYKPGCELVIAPREDIEIDPPDTCVTMATTHIKIEVYISEGDWE